MLRQIEIRELLHRWAIKPEFEADMIVLSPADQKRVDQWLAERGFNLDHLPETSRPMTACRLKDASKGEGYFGYRFRILTGQGDNIAGGAYDYVINGNMIGVSADRLASQICRDRREHFRCEPTRHRLSNRPGSEHGGDREIY